MAGDLPEWAVRLREERVRRLWSQKVMAVRLRDAADDYARARLPAAENIARRVRGYEAGDHFPGAMYVELYCRAFGLTRDLLFGPSGGHADAGCLVPASGSDVSGLAAWITVSNVTDEAIREIERRRIALAEAHASITPGRVLADVLDLHRQVQALLQGGRQRCRQSRELFRIDAGLLAHASLLLDDIAGPGSATAHAGTAILCAEEAGSSPALALSAQAKTARWQGTAVGARKGTAYFARSADLARRGFECSRGSAVRVLMAAQEASAAALLGDGNRARKALHDAEDAAGSVPAVPALSTWACPGTRRALYGLSVAIRLGDPDAALHAAEAADECWKSGEPWQYGVWSLIRIGAATAHVMKSDVQAASMQLGGVFALAPAFRITTMTGYLADLDSRLAQRRFRDVPAARDLREQIAVFSAAADPAALAAETEGQ